MSLTRQTQKVFGSNANANQLAVFGSMKTGTPIYSTNLSTLQSTAYTQGWSEALLNDKAPYMEEMNAVQYGLSYQIAYMLQEGAFSYDANTNYSSTSIVKAFENGKMYFYHSLIDNNQGHALSDSTYWEKINISDTRNIGEIVQSAIPLTDAGLHLLDGSVLSGSGSYGAFVSYIAGLYATDPTANYFTTEADWQTAFLTYGVCGKFVYDSVNNTVRLPKYSNKIYTSGLGTAPVIGNGNPIGLTRYNYDKSSGETYTLGLSTNDGDLYGKASYTSSYNTVGISTNAAKSGLIAQLSDITTSLDGYYYIVIATSTKTSIQVDIDEIATDLNGKADVDLTNTTPAQSFKNSVMTWGMPDYDNGISIDLSNLSTTNTNFTVPANGFIRVKLKMSNALDAFFVDDKAIFGWDSSMSLDGGWSAPIPIYSGTHTFRINAVPSRAVSFIFYPFKGGN